ncbi:MAG: acyl carrier protein [Actinobacteria bacterium]|nr:acyl carrier protein [Actinomycetota bacterium]
MSATEVKQVLVQTLALESRADSLGSETRLFGSLPELDSMAVLELVTALEDRFGIEIEADELTAETFETLGSLADFVASKRG